MKQQSKSDSSRNFNVLASHEEYSLNEFVTDAGGRKSPGSNRKLFSAEIAERRNWTRGIMSGGRVRRGDWSSREERYSRRRADSASRCAAPLRFRLVLRTCRRPRIKVRYPIAFRSLVVAASRRCSCIARWVTRIVECGRCSARPPLHHIDPELLGRMRSRSRP